MSIKELKTYQVRPSGKTLEEVLAQSNADCFQAFAFGRVNPIGYFALLLEGLQALPNCHIGSLRRFSEEPLPGKTAVFLRHDVDHDINAARAMSRLEQHYGLTGNFYILHSHPLVTPSYYAEYSAHSNEFLRHECLGIIYKEISAAGHELGLHVDAATLYAHDIDGTAAVREELRWLQALGLPLHGTVAHNSYPYMGLENFEIFEERHLLYQKTVNINGHQILLGQIPEKEFGLTYEANYATPHPPNSDALALYREQGSTDDTPTHLRWYLHDNPYCRWGADYTCWLYGLDRWVISGQGPDSLFEPQAGLRRVLNFLRCLPAGNRVVLHVHPCYVGARTGTNDTPLAPEGMLSNIDRQVEIYTYMASLFSNLESHHIIDVDHRIAALETYMQSIDTRLQNTFTERFANLLQKLLFKMKGSSRHLD